MTIEELIKACLNHDKRAQQALFYQYAPVLMGISIRYVKDEATAQDVVQESFVRIFKSLGSIRQVDTRSVVSWMKQITIRESIRWIKKNERYQFDKSEEVLGAMKAPQKDELEEKDLLKLLTKLPVGYRAIFNLYVIEGYSHQEIGDLLNISASTSRSQLSRAKKQLQEWIKYNNEYVIE